MNKLIIENGGMPLHGNDLTFAENAIREVIKGLAIAPGDNYILFGCEPDLEGNTPITEPIDISPGYIVLDGEILYFAGGQYIINGFPNPGGGTIPYSYKLETSFDPTGLDAFADGTFKETYQVRRAICDPTTADAQIIVNDAKTYQDVMRSHLGIDTNPYIEPSLLNGYQGSIKATKVGEIAFLEAAVTTGTTNIIIAIIPSDFRPVNEIYSQVTFKDGSNALLDNAKTRITSAGELIIVTETNTALPVAEIAYINLSFKTN